MIGQRTIAKMSIIMDTTDFDVQARAIRGINYILGWNAQRAGEPGEWCLTDSQVAGWKASARADEAMRKAGVRP